MLKKIKIMLIAISLIFTTFWFYPITKADSSSTLYVGGDGQGNYSKIQDAIDNASGGDTIFVYNGTYYENLFIYLPINLIGENKSTTFIDGWGNGNVVMVYNATNVSISGFTIQNSSAHMSGLVVWYSDNNKVFNNIFTNNNFGIYLKINSSENIIHHNYFINNNYNAFDYTTCKNRWDDGSEGNYWEDYTGNDADEDGIGDTPYNTLGTYSCKDRYPLMTLPSHYNPPYTPLNPAPQIEGPKTGKQNIEYNFTVFSTNSDNYNIRYVFRWGDDQTNETDFIANGTEFVQKHKWLSPGIFKIEVFAINNDNKTLTSAETYILIDVIYCKNIGYFIDENSDGIYDLFYSNQTGNKTITERLENGSYLINNDMDNDWDYIYNTQTDLFSPYSSETATSETNADNTIFYAIAIVIIMLLLLYAMLGKKPKEEKKIEKEEKVEKQIKAKQKPKKDITKKKQTKTQKK